MLLSVSCQSQNGNSLVSHVTELRRRHGRGLAQYLFAWPICCLPVSSGSDAFGRYHRLPESEVFHRQLCSVCEQVLVYDNLF